MKVLCLQWLAIINMDTKLNNVLQANSLKCVHKASTKVEWKLMKQIQNLVMSKDV